MVVIFILSSSSYTYLMSLIYDTKVLLHVFVFLVVIVYRVYLQCYDAKIFCGTNYMLHIHVIIYQSFKRLHQIDFQQYDVCVLFLLVKSGTVWVLCFPEETVESVFKEENVNTLTVWLLVTPSVIILHCHNYTTFLVTVFSLHFFSYTSLYMHQHSYNIRS